MMVLPVKRSAWVRRDRPIVLLFFEDVSVYVMLLHSNKGVANPASRSEM